MTHMSWKTWCQYWQEQEPLKEFRKEVATVEEPEVSSVFIILNEWTDLQGNASSAVVDSKYFESEDEAWEALNIIAQSFGTTLYADEYDLQFEDHAPGLQSEEYYIQELSKGSS